MTDAFEPQNRSRIMASIKQKDTAPEIAIRRALRSKGFRYRLHLTGLRGRPDLVSPSTASLSLCMAASGTSVRDAATPLYQQTPQSFARQSSWPTLLGIAPFGERCLRRAGAWRRSGTAPCESPNKSP